MTPAQLKSSILQLAIQGKLVPQIPAEGTGEELYQQIQKEKQALIKSGKIKKEKPLPPIAEDEIPFEIPEGWRWCRLNELLLSLSTGPFGSMLHKTDYIENGIPLVNPANIVNNKIEPSNKMMVSDETRERLSGYILRLGMIVMGRRGEMGRCAIVTQREDGWLCGTGSFFMKPSILLYIKYIQMIFSTMYAKCYLSGESVGTTMSNLNHNILIRMPIPLPPLAEQRRIVAKIEELMPLIDRYDKAWTQIEAIQKKFPGDLKKSILQMAIQGKLVPQIPAEGTGEELYQQIQKEKQTLIKSGKIKKEKPLPPIADDEIPFEIPEGWRWCYLGELYQHNTGKALNSSNSNGMRLTYITTSNLYWDYFELNNLKSMTFTETEVEKCTIRKGDLLVCEGGDYGRAAIWPYDMEMRIQNHIHRLREYKQLVTKYFYYILFLYKNTGFIVGKGIGIKGLSSNALHAIVIPLPPLAEQKRIVAKIEELMTLVDKLGIRN